MQARATALAQRLEAARARIPAQPAIEVAGTLKRVVGLTLEAAGCRAALGDRCAIEARDGADVEAEVVGFAGERTFLMPTGSVHGIVPEARVRRRAGGATVRVGPDWLGRVLDGEGAPLDGQPRPRGDTRMPLFPPPLNPLARNAIDEPLDVGVRAINAALTVGRGQRIGLFAGSGVGKSTLLGMMTRYTSADVIVVALIGERGREVRDFVHGTLGREGLKRACVIATPADRPPLMRLNGAWLATTVAEYFRDQGLQVLLLMDSLTRFAQASREIGLAVGEPPATRGYPPSAFARLPQLVERAGQGDSGAGSITAFYTVLVEGDDLQDPVADSARAILDGHVVLSRSVADSGMYPAIDIEASVSRVASEITAPEHRARVRRLRALISAYMRNRELINLGAYQAGSDPRVDEAVKLWPRIEAFLRQDVHEPAAYAASVTALAELLK